MAFWVFGHGSLFWNPGLTPVETVRATLPGYHRSFCMESIHYRGTKEVPGLVLALDEARGAQCTGLAFRVANADEYAVLDMLRKRELISDAYLEVQVDVTDTDGTAINCVTYVMNKASDQYCQFDLEKQAKLIARSAGVRGPNCDYLYNTQEKLTSLNIRDDDMTWLVRRVRELTQTE